MTDSSNKRNSGILNSLRAKRDMRETERTRISMLLAAQIAKALRSKELSKLRFAEAMGKSPSVITRWLSGTHNFTCDTLSDIQGFLGIQLLNTKHDQTPIVSAPGDGHVTMNVFITEKEYSKIKKGEGSPFEFATESNTQVIRSQFFQLESANG